MTNLQNWLAALSILSILAAAIYQLVRIVIQTYAVLEQIKQNCYASDLELDEKIDRLNDDLSELKQEVRGIRAVIRRFLPDPFRRLSDEANRQEDSDRQ
ncbi:hypothetical protein C7H19_23710 [Aphanothece hegewaldii CCALA 016]|uniref:Uncharacterized protein n=1 Tax=Aphanothece hegewaldii CCALA 016 TaxID=2107694 RepID=A0A2T1LR35_9CHRO|nr:hypothetical protein [Aphanothece hegewaldii]PSF30591.1 hypothetical protein C7H19_23710 [Aphanothece hegewaldii CCALA 016]